MLDYKGAIFFRSIIWSHLAANQLLFDPPSQIDLGCVTDRQHLPVAVLLHLAVGLGVVGVVLVVVAVVL
jgi:hypothetical protein